MYVIVKLNVLFSYYGYLIEILRNTLPKRYEECNSQFYVYIHISNVFSNYGIETLKSRTLSKHTIKVMQLKFLQMGIICFLTVKK